MSLLSKIRGTIETLFQLGIGGPQLKNNGGVIEARNAADSGFAVVRGGAPVGQTDLVTKLYADSLSKPLIVTAQFDGNNVLPSNTSSLHYIVVSTTGANGIIGEVLYDDGSNTGTVTRLSAVNGRTIAVTVSLSGGTVQFDPDSIYQWDADGSSGTTQWVKIGDIGSVTGAVREIRYTINNSATQDSVSLIPANACIVSAEVSVTTPYSGGGTIAVGQPGNTTLLQATTDNNPQSANIYQVPGDIAWGGSGLVVRTTVGGSPAAGAGVVIVRYTVPNA